MSSTGEAPRWDFSNAQAKFGTAYTDQEREALVQGYVATLADIREHEVVQGTVVAISNRDVIVNINFKSDGLIPRNEFRDLPDLQPGDAVEVYIERQEDAKGQLVLSRKKAKLVRGWERIQSAADHREVLTGQVKRRTKGGLIMDIHGIEAFLPGSQIDTKPIHDFDIYVGKPMEVIVVKINHTNDNVVVSHKALIEQSLESQKVAIISSLERGQVLEGTIKNMTSFGVFIDLGGVDGLLHITDISWGRMNHPEEALTLGQKVRVVVLDFNEDKKRISLGMKQLTQHPWEALPSTFEVGATVKGRVVNIADYGAFLEVMPGVEGLMHISEMSWSPPSNNIRDLVKIGDELEAKVLTLDREARKMSLGRKQLTSDPWSRSDLPQRYAVGTKHQGVVKNLTHFGVFLELEGGIEGLLHVSDLSTAKVGHPSEVVHAGDTLEVVVLNIDPASKKLSLGRKQLEENISDEHEGEFVVGSTHRGTLDDKIDGGASVMLPHDVKGFAPQGSFIKENGHEATVGESLIWKVIEYAKETKQIILSHTAVFSEAEETITTPLSKKRKGAARARQVEKKSTLGDIKTLANLKEKLDAHSERAV